MSPPGGRPATVSATSTPSRTRSSTSSARWRPATNRLPRSLTALPSSVSSTPSRPAPIPAPGRRSHHDAPDHVVHRPVGRSAVGGGGPAGLGVGVGGGGDRLLG